MGKECGHWLCQCFMLETHLLHDMTPSDPTTDDGLQISQLI